MSKDIARCGGIIIFSDNTASKVLLVCGNKLGSLGFTKGMCENNETCRHGAAREVKEESGISINNLMISDHYMEETSASGEVILRYYTAYNKEGLNIELKEPDSKEITKISYYNCEDINFSNLLSSSRYNMLVNSIKHIKDNADLFYNGSLFLLESKQDLPISSHISNIINITDVESLIKICGGKYLYMKFKVYFWKRYENKKYISRKYFTLYKQKENIPITESHVILRVAVHEAFVMGDIKFKYNPTYDVIHTNALNGYLSKRYVSLVE